jgi:predicted GNAT family acetyltransferase
VGAAYTAPSWAPQVPGALKGAFEIGKPILKYGVGYPLAGLGIGLYKGGEAAVNAVKDYRAWAKKMDDEEAAKVAAMKAMPQKKRKKRRPKKPSPEKLQYARASRGGITGRAGQRVLMPGLGEWKKKVAECILLISKIHNISLKESLINFNNYFNNFLETKQKYIVEGYTHNIDSLTLFRESLIEQYLNSEDEEIQLYSVKNVHDIVDNTIDKSIDKLEPVIRQIRDILSTLSFREALPVYYFLRFIPTSACYTYIYKIKKEPAGVVLLYKQPDDVLYIVIAVKKKFFGRGISQKLTRKAVQYGLKNNFKYIEWGCSFYNKGSYKAALKYGFKIARQNPLHTTFILDLNKLRKNQNKETTQS